jgi:hypothetical protein
MPGIVFLRFRVRETLLRIEASSIVLLGREGEVFYVRFYTPSLAGEG